MNTQHSRYWIDEDIFGDDEFIDEDKQSQSVATIMKLAAVRRAIGNFVSIVGGKNIPVRFNDGKDSYTDGNTVVIAADHNPKNFDVMVGLALHEGSHILLSDFKFLQYVVAPIIRMPGLPSITTPIGNVLSSAPSFIGYSYLMPALVDYLVDKNCGSRTEYNRELGITYGHIKTIMNVLEDRRIDAYVYRVAKGYRPYYNALYEKYFLNKDVGKNLKNNPEWKVPTIENYINHLLLSIHPDFDIDALPHMRDIIALMDIDNIDRVAPENDPMTKYRYNPTSGALNNVGEWQINAAFEYTPILWQEANRIYWAIVQYAKQEEMNTANPSESASGGGGGDSSAESENEDSDEGSGTSDQQNEEAPTATPKAKPNYNGQRGQKALNVIKDFVEGDVKKKKITAKQRESLNSIELANATLETVTVDGVGKVECMVVRKVTERINREPWYPFGYLPNSWYQEKYMNSIAAGKRMGAIMLNKLQVRNDPVYTKNIRLNTGKIDRRMLANLGMNIDSVFYKDSIDTHKPAMLHLSLDGSGSMRGDPWAKSVTVATAIAYVASKLNNIDAVITVRGSADMMPVVVIAYDSRKDNFTDFIRNIGCIEPSGTTPEGLCFDAIHKLILDSKNTHDVYFINFSDGVPVCGVNSLTVRFNYEGNVAVQHTRKVVNKLRDNGVKILSYYIESDAYYTSQRGVFKTMYGEDASFIDVTNVTQVLTTLNNRLLVR